MAKSGSQFVRDMIDRGRRELGGALYGESNIAQPMYPLHGSREAAPKHSATDREDVSRGAPPAQEDIDRDGRDAPDLDH